MLTINRITYLYEQFNSLKNRLWKDGKKGLSLIIRKLCKNWLKYVFQLSFILLAISIMFVQHIKPLKYLKLEQGSVNSIRIFISLKKKYWNRKIYKKGKKYLLPMFPKQKGQGNINCGMETKIIVRAVS